MISLHLAICYVEPHACLMLSLLANAGPKNTSCPCAWLAIMTRVWVVLMVFARDMKFWNRNYNQDRDYSNDAVCANFVSEVSTQMVIVWRLHGIRCYYMEQMHVWHITGLIICNTNISVYFLDRHTHYCITVLLNIQYLVCFSLKLHECACGFCRFARWKLIVLNVLGLGCCGDNFLNLIGASMPSFGDQNQNSFS